MVKKGGKKYHEMAKRQGKKVIIDCVADLHGHFPKLQGGDLLIVAGDLTSWDTEEEHLDFIMWLCSPTRELRYKKIIYIAGNHDDFLFNRERHGALKTPPQYNIEYLADSGTEFQGMKIWGSPWTKTFEGMNPACKAFTVDTEAELAEKWKMIPDDVDILVTHGPPSGVGDLTKHGEHVGSTSLHNELHTRLKPKLHVFGHIHECGSQELVLKRYGYGTENNTRCINCSFVNEKYQPVNKPIRVIL